MCSGNPWRGGELFSCAGEVRHVVIGVPGDDAPPDVPIAALGACDACTLGVASWLELVARYDEGVVISYEAWLRDVEAPDLDNPVRTAV